MKKIVLLLIFFSILTILLLDIPKYNELNNISIIDKITINCSDNNYNVTLREVTLHRKDNGITFRYSYYKNDIKNIYQLKNNYLDKYHKVFYYDKVKVIDTNCNNSDEFKNIFNKNVIINKNKELS